MADIIRLHQSSMGEISGVAPLGDYVYYLYMRRFQPVAYLKVNVKNNVVSESFMPPYPLTTWFWAKHLNKVVFVGQNYTEGWETNDPCKPSSQAVSVVNEGGIFSFHAIIHTDNVNELIGACYHNGQFKAGERSGELSDYYKRCAAHPDGGGIWVSDDGKSWSWSGFKDPMLPLIGKGRECYLAVLNGELYAFMHGGQVNNNVPTSIYKVLGDYSAQHICYTPENNIGLVPFPFSPNENDPFTWKGNVIMRTSYPALGVFDGSTLRFWNIKINDQPIINASAVPVGIRDGKLLLTVSVGAVYTVVETAELFGEVRQVAENWMPGTYVKGIIANNKVWLGVMGTSSALDMLPLEAPPEKRKLTLIVTYAGEPIKNAEVEAIYG